MKKITCLSVSYFGSLSARFLSVFFQPSLPLPFSLVAIISAEMASPGRRLDDVSKFFHRDASKRPNVKATCKDCGKKICSIYLIA